MTFNYRLKSPHYLNILRHAKMLLHVFIIKFYVKPLQYQQVKPANLTLHPALL
jgi:hypothetical protein